ncbi:Transposase DDE domain protein [Gemmata sp. SH-PL17]|uniref:transposase n=2 Tax=Gemmata sp. SH-PL17 TaxID=1630693 RepID=UPI00078D6CBB|nr:transposase [Gemmata sp. SH-PL17]AMV23705.1 Transposase DDE domain protein [Gemmata sp. SH-PL17]AMV29843.1 Transposase DDE domain protein [Gemmata sp. SH-PL17]
MVPAAFEPFLKASPVCVLARTILERLFLPERLDQLFRDTAQRQYQHELLFSQVVELMLATTLRTESSLGAAYHKRAEHMPVSRQAVYDKLRSTELGICAALVRDSADQVAPLIRTLQATRAPLVPGYRTRVLDGNYLSATQRRLRVHRDSWAAPLPGKVLAIYDPQLDLVTDVFLTPDGHANERELIPQVVPHIGANDLWIADRNFCTLGFLSALHEADAGFVIRQHGALEGALRGERRALGRCETGQGYEQEVEFRHLDRTLRVRRVTVVLDQPTRDGDTEIHVLTNVPSDAADGCRVAALYLKRWLIENRFYELAMTLNCEPDTLAYPPAALFAFCLGLLASNAVALLKGAVRSAHGAEAVSELSSYYLTEEIRTTWVGMNIALPGPLWEPLGAMPLESFAELLRAIAARVDPKRYRKAKRGPKNPPPTKKPYQNGGHVSTHRLLQKRKR